MQDPLGVRRRLPLDERVASATSADYAARETGALREQIVPGMAQQIAVALAEAAANKRRSGSTVW